MTEFELIEATGVYISASIASVSLYLTIISAYLITAYITGQKLNSSQVLVVNILFITAALIFTYSTIGMLFRQQYFAKQLAEIETDTLVAGTAPLGIIMSIIQLGGIIACLKFMWDIRHPGSK